LPSIASQLYFRDHRPQFISKVSQKADYLSGTENILSVNLLAPIIQAAKSSGIQDLSELDFLTSPQNSQIRSVTEPYTPPHYAKYWITAVETLSIAAMRIKLDN
jgi:hypothetical protein